MSDTRATRLPPEVIFVPPPSGPGMPPQRVKGPLGGCAVGGLVCLVLVFMRGWGLVHWIMIMAPILVAVAVITAVIAWRMDRRLRALREAFFAKHPRDNDDPLVAALAKTWSESDRAPKAEDVQAALHAGTNRQEVRPARVVCFGVPGAPLIGELHFEPLIVTPTGALWQQLFWLVAAGVPVTWCLLDLLNLLPSWLPGARPLFGGFAYFLVAGAVALAVWIWKGMIRPTYIRMAPGIIQVLEYRYSKSKPTIRSYPMETGTLAMFTRLGKHLILTLARDEMKDVLPLSRMRRSEQLIERAWQALLSTAPTPPLSEEELVG